MNRSDEFIQECVRKVEAAIHKASQDDVYSVVRLYSGVEFFPGVPHMVAQQVWNLLSDSYKSLLHLVDDTYPFTVQLGHDGKGLYAHLIFKKPQP